VARTTILETRRTRLTTWLPDDLDDLHRLHSDPDTMRWIRPGRPVAIEDSRARLATYLAEQRSGATKWRVEDLDSGAFVARAGFGEDAAHRALGYTLLPEAWGRGLATELATALVAWHRAHPLVDPTTGLPGDLTAYAALENAASCRVLEKAGLVLVCETEHNGWPSALYRLG
jgi:ribosomal-protein-alanine N-acetyltransferase